MVDLVDMAEEFRALQMQERINARAQFESESLYGCAECGCVIPPQRRSIGGVTRCVDCQENFEAQQKHLR